MTITSNDHCPDKLERLVNILKGARPVGESPYAVCDVVSGDISVPAEVPACQRRAARDPSIGPHQNYIATEEAPPRPTRPGGRGPTTGPRAKLLCDGGVTSSPTPRRTKDPYRLGLAQYFFTTKEGPPRPT